MKRTLRHTLLGLVATLSLAASLPALAFDEQSTSAINVDKHGVILHGYDAVAYFEGKPAKGSVKYTATYDGATYQFASAAHRDAFTANPQKYAPQFGGFCALGVSRIAKVDIDPHAYKIVGDKLYVNINPKGQKFWLTDLDNNIHTAEQQWPQIRNKAPKDLQ